MGVMTGANTAGVDRDVATQDVAHRARIHGVGGTGMGDLASHGEEGGAAAVEAVSV